QTLGDVRLRCVAAADGGAVPLDHDLAPADTVDVRVDAEREEGFRRGAQADRQGGAIDAHDTGREGALAHGEGQATLHDLERQSGTSEAQVQGRGVGVAGGCQV